MNRSGAMPSGTKDWGEVMSTTFSPRRLSPEAASSMAWISDWQEPRPIRST